MNRRSERLAKLESRVSGQCAACPWRTMHDWPDEKLEQFVNEMEIGHFVCLSDEELEADLDEIFSSRFGLTFDDRVRRLAEKLIENHKGIVDRKP